jgi:hypothetical protein
VTGALRPLPATFSATRAGLHALACYVISPMRKARTGRIGLRPTGDGFGTPLFDDGTRVLVRGDRLVHEPHGDIEITTVTAAAEWLGVARSADPGVGDDLPPFRPDEQLAVNAVASFALGAWYGFGAAVLDSLPAALSDADLGEAQLWPEHFDLAVVATTSSGREANVGFSPGDAWSDEPYVYVGPYDTSDLEVDAWNAPFGATLGYGSLVGSTEPRAAVIDFVASRLALLS